jgi:plasmid stabilization system protein ParE
MAGKSLELHPSALAELKSAVIWYLERNQAAAISFVTDIDHAIELVRTSPHRWPKGDDETRRFVLKRFPYALVYREKESTVQVLAIAHGHRRPGYWKGRL